jgi:hypothetical protein
MSPVVLELMFHDIDLGPLALVSAPIAQVEASGAPFDRKYSIIANARLRFANGCVANVTASRISNKQMRQTCEYSSVMPYFRSTC